MRDAGDLDALKNLPRSWLVAEDLLPTEAGQRHISPVDFWLIWVGMSIILTTFIVGASLYPHLAAWEIILAVALGNALVCVVLALTGDIGITHGLPFAVYIRVCYGYLGTHIPSIIRAFPAMFWFGFQTWLGAEAINTILKALTAWPGTYPYLVLIIVVFAGVQVYTTARGVRAIAYFDRLAAPALLLLGLYILYWIMQRFGLSVTAIITTPRGEVEGARYSFAYAMTAMTGYWATMALNIPDFTRYLKAKASEPNWYRRNSGSIWAQFLSVVPAMSFFAFVGMASSVATGSWNPIDVITDMTQVGTMWFLALLVVVLAQWSTNIGANILPPANIFANVFAPRVNFAWGCIIAGVIGLVIRPWVLADQIIHVFVYISAMLGGIAGTMISDYYFLRGRRLNLLDLYRPHGQYTYYRNINPAGFIAYVCGFGVSLVNLDYCYFISAIVSGVVYYVLMRYWIAVKYPQPEILERFRPKPGASKSIS